MDAIDMIAEKLGDLKYGDFTKEAIAKRKRKEARKKLVKAQQKKFKADPLRTAKVFTRPTPAPRSRVSLGLPPR